VKDEEGETTEGAVPFFGKTVPFYTVLRVIEFAGMNMEAVVKTGILYSVSVQVVDREVSTFFWSTEVQKFPVFSAKQPWERVVPFFSKGVPFCSVFS
jgi:hypothetical protein